MLYVGKENKRVEVIPRRKMIVDLDLLVYLMGRILVQVSFT